MKLSRTCRSDRRIKAALSIGVAAFFASGLAGCGDVSGGADEKESATIHEPEQPNILMILVDDLGYTDFGAYGSEIDTPYIDTLTEDSAQFTDFHVNPLCAPTRAELMTGQAPQQVGLGSMEGVTPPGVAETTPGYKGSLEGEFVGIAEVLDDAGYDTYQVGKWHLGADEGQSPQDLGFQESFTLVDAGASYFADGYGIFDKPEESFDTATYQRNGEDLETLPEDFFTTRSFTDEMIDMTSQSVAEGKPFFGYLGHNAPHDPLHVENDELVDRYLDLYLDKDFEEVRTERTQRLAELGLLEDGPETRWFDKTPEWGSLTNLQQQDLAYRMATYAAVVHETDQQIGRLIEHLKDIGAYDDTLIAVVSDNGPSASTQLMYERFTTEEGWHDRVYPRKGDMDAYGKQGSFPSATVAWAQVSSGPFFHAKSTLFEGGIRVPAIIKSPATDEPYTHRVLDEFTTISDLYPTFVDYAGADITETSALLGESLLPLLEDNAEIEDDREHGWESFGHRAYRSGDWKLIFAPQEFGGTGKYALYNLADDPGETRDLAAEHPEMVAQLSNKWDHFAEENGIAVVDFELVNEASKAIVDGRYAIDWADN